MRGASNRHLLVDARTRARRREGCPARSTLRAPGQFPYDALQDGSEFWVFLFQQPADVFAVVVRLIGVTHFASSFLTDHQWFSLTRPWCTRRQGRRPSPGTVESRRKPLLGAS